MDKLDEVKKLKQLLDEGIIDEDDFKKKKAQILGLVGNNVKAESKGVVEESKETKTNKIKSKSLDEYEKELMEQSEQEEIKEDSSTKSNDDYYQKEKLKARAKLDAEEEIRKYRKEEQKAEQKAAIDKGVTKTKRIFKWILAGFCWIVALGTALGVVEGNIVVNIISLLIYLVLGCMACPKITDITQNNSKFDAYTKHKTLIVWILIIVWVVLINAFPVPSTETDTNTNDSNNTVETNK